MSAVALSTASIIARMDLQSPFVTVAVDSDRINATLKLMASALSAMQTSLDHANERISQNSSDTAALRAELDAQKAKTAALEEKMSVVDHVERRMTSLERNTEAKIQEITDEQRKLKASADSADTRIVQLQKQRAEDQSALNKIVADATRANAEAKEAVANLNAKIDQLNAQFDAASVDAAATKNDLLTVVRVFDIDLRAAAAAVAEGKGKNTDYVLGLPSFARLRGDILKSALEEIALLRAALHEKLDAKLFYKMEDRLDECLRSAKSAMAMAERASTEVANKVDRTEFKASIERLQTIKADQSDLMNLASKSDFGVLQTAMSNLRIEVEKHLSEQQLENRESRLRLANQNANGGGFSQQAQEQLADLLQRVVELEKTAVHLEDVKADRTELAALQQFVEDSLANYSIRRDRPQSGGMPGRRTPTNDPLVSTPRRRLLSPITRPSSASIPETYKMPNEPLYYTSLPVRSDSPKRSADHSGASTQIFDANGHRTTATLQQGKPVPAAEHYANMMKVASGETVIPPGFVLHQIPNI